MVLLIETCNRGNKRLRIDRACFPNETQQHTELKLSTTPVINPAVVVLAFRSSTTMLQQTTMVFWPGKTCAAACLTLGFLSCKLAGHKLLLILAALPAHAP